MIKNIFIIVVLLILMPWAGVVAQEAYTQYYKYINKAELAICDSNFTEAGKYYKAAFNVNKDRPFAIDLCNAMYAALDCNDIVEANKYLKILLKKGITKDYIQFALKSLDSSKKTWFKKMLSENINHIPKEAPITKKLTELHNADQSIREYVGNYFGVGGYQIDTTYSVDEHNAKELHKLFVEKQLPNEDLDRFYDYNVIILHNTAAALGGRRAHIFDSLLYEALSDFRFDARTFAALVSTSPQSPRFQYKNLYLDMPLIVTGASYKDKTYIEYYDDTSESRINMNRAKIGLESLTEYRKKAEAKNQNVKWISKYGFNTLNFVRVIENEDGLNRWLGQYGANAVKKQSVSSYKFVVQRPDSIGVGIIGNQYVIGKTKYADVIKYYNSILQEYHHKNIPYQDRAIIHKNLPWGYRAEIVSNRKDSLHSNNFYANNPIAATQNYLITMEDAFTSYIGVFKAIELVFDNRSDSSLICFTADVDASMLKVLSRVMGMPKNKKKTIAVPNPAIQGAFTNLYHSTYIWQKGSLVTKIESTDYLDKNGNRKTKFLYQMVDTNRYRK